MKFRTLRKITGEMARMTGILSVTFLLFASHAFAVPSLGPTGNYYEVIESRGISWADAKAVAEGMSYMGNSGYLATIGGSGENAFVEGLRVASNLGQVWLGGFQNPNNEMNPGASWMWVHGEGSITYFNWALGEPNDAYGPASEQYLAIGLFGNDTWNDEGNLNNISGYVVEYAGGDTGSPQSPTMHCPNEHIRHWDKIIFTIRSKNIANRVGLPFNEPLDIKVLDDPNEVADLKGKVIAFITKKGDGSGVSIPYSAIRILDVDYAISGCIAAPSDSMYGFKKSQGQK